MTKLYGKPRLRKSTQSDSLFQRLSDVNQYHDPNLTQELRSAVIANEGSELASLKGRSYAPHCDQKILHTPGDCEYCDRYPEWQLAREVHRINYTGMHDPNKLPCPSEVDRPFERLNRWGGNQAKKWS